jgi:hypothetical protein
LWGIYVEASIIFCNNTPRQFPLSVVTIINHYTGTDVLVLRHLSMLLHPSLYGTHLRRNAQRAGDVI